MRWRKTKRNHCFKVLFSLILRNNSEPFLNWIVMCYEYDNQHRPAQWLDREEVPKHFLKPNLHQKRSWSLFGGLLPIGPTIAFWIPASPYVWGVRSANQWDAPKTALPTVGIVNRKGPILLHSNAQPRIIQPTLQKLNGLGYEVLSHLLHSPDLSPTDYHFFKHLNNFLYGECSHNQQEAENTFQELGEFWNMDFYATGINKIVSYWKTCVDYNSFYFD